MKKPQSTKKTHTITPTHRRMRFVLGVVCILWGMTTFMRLFLPMTEYFSFDAQIHSLANTISRPYITARGTGFDIRTDGLFDKITLVITLPPDDKPLAKDTTVTAQKSYAAFLSPIGTEKYTAHETTTIDVDEKEYYLQKDDTLYPFLNKNVFDSYLFKTHTHMTKDDFASYDFTVSSDVRGFAPATLIASKDAIFIIDGAKKHPVQDVATIEALGYRFDTVRETTSDERTLHKKARMYTTDSTHPFGTLFFARDTKHTYIYDNNQIFRIQSTPRAQKHAIVVDEKSRDAFARCTLRKKWFPKNTYTCTMRITDIAQFPGNTFQFHISAPQLAIAQSHITLHRSAWRDALDIRLQLAKDIFLKNYRE